MIIANSLLVLTHASHIPSQKAKTRVAAYRVHELTADSTFLPLRYVPVHIAQCPHLEAVPDQHP